MVTKNIQLDDNILETSIKLFQQYGLNLSEGINILLQKIINKPELLDIEEISKDDEDYKLISQTRGEETISLDEFMKLW